jgi:serine/threonine protein kinase
MTIGLQDGLHYLVTELLEGETLRAVMASGTLSVRKAIEYAMQIAHGIAAAHDRSITNFTRRESRHCHGINHAH